MVVSFFARPPSNSPEKRVSRFRCRQPGTTRDPRRSIELLRHRGGQFKSTRAPLDTRPTSTRETCACSPRSARRFSRSLSWRSWRSAPHRAAPSSRLPRSTTRSSTRSCPTLRRSGWTRTTTSARTLPTGSPARSSPFQRRRRTPTSPSPRARSSPSRNPSPSPSPSPSPRRNRKRRRRRASRRRRRPPPRPRAKVPRRTCA